MQRLRKGMALQPIPNGSLRIHVTLEARVTAGLQKSANWRSCVICLDAMVLLYVQLRSAE